VAAPGAARDDERVDGSRGPLTVAVDGWTIRAQHGLPGTYDVDRRHAVLCEEIGLADAEGDCWFLAAAADGELRPRLVVAQRYAPAGYGFNPGIAFVPATGVLFAGAGTRLLAYALSGRPRRLWEDAADMGFWHWSVHGPTVVMAAELELAAWDHRGGKLWSMFVEPPWTYQVTDGRVQLDVMGTRTQFSVRSGPGSACQQPAPDT
jgi:hypothetical protein